VTQGDPPPYQVPDEARAAAIRRVLGEYLQVEPIEPGLARRLLAEGVRSFVELGAAHGPISRLLAPEGVACVAVDAVRSLRASAARRLEIRATARRRVRRGVGRELPLLSRRSEGPAQGGTPPPTPGRAVPGFVAQPPSRPGDQAVHPGLGHAGSVRRGGRARLVAEVFGGL